MYDFANSAFATTVMAGFFPLFFKQYWSHGTDVNTSTALLGLGNSAASLVVALMAPLLGSIADRGGAKKKFLTFFAYLGALMTACLFTVQKGGWEWAIFFYIMGIIGFSGSQVFYDALLVDVAGEKRIDAVSSLGYGLGYLGGGLLFLVNVLMTLMPEKFGLENAAEAVRYSFVSVGIWWGAFTLLTILWVEERKGDQKPAGIIGTVREGFAGFVDTFKKIRVLKTAFLFLVAYWFYIDGVDTIVRMAVDYGISLGFAAHDLIKALLITQFIGFPSAIAFGKLGRTFGVKRAIFLAIFIYILVTFWGTFMTQRHEFYILAGVIGLVQGGIQALSRSYYARLIPENRAAQFYGFYNMLGKFAAIMGPALMGLSGLAARALLMPPSPTPLQMEQVGQLASRWSIASIVLLFIIGAVLLWFVDEALGKKELEDFMENQS